MSEFREKVGELLKTSTITSHPGEPEILQRPSWFLPSQDIINAASGDKLDDLIGKLQLSYPCVEEHRRKHAINGNLSTDEKKRIFLYNMSNLPEVQQTYQTRKEEYNNRDRDDGQGKLEVFKVVDISEEEILQAEKDNAIRLERKRKEYTIDIGIPLPDPSVSLGRREFGCSDEGNADRLVTQYGDKILYSSLERRWYVWTGQKWERDDELRVQAIAKRTVRTILVEAAHTPEEYKQRELIKWAADSAMLSRVRAMVDSAAPLRAVKPDVFDAKEELFNFTNGTLNLYTGSFQPANPRDRITKIAGTHYDPKAKCPQWEAHLKRIFNYDEPYIAGLQTFLGYCMLQWNPAQIMAIFHGSGRNGKSVTLGAVSRVFGDYGVTLSADSLAAKRSDSPDAARGDLASLKGARLCAANEGESGAVLAESLIKSLTGDDKIRVRRQYEQGFEFRPGAKIILVTNHTPRIRGQDLAIWRRIWLFPFSVTIDEKEQDPDLLDKLTKEGPGIINWLLIGLNRYLETRKLEPPKKVVSATRAYQSEQDVIGQFFDAELIETPNIGSSMPRKQVYGLYTQWCEQEGERPASNRRVAAYLTERGIQTGYAAGRRAWLGIRLKTDGERKEAEEREDADE
jgi:putative DNA primase/helicase